MELPLGTHRLLIQGDVIRLRIIGSFGPQDLVAYMKVRDQLLKVQSHVYTLLDLSEGTELPAETRRLATSDGFRDKNNDHRVALAYYGVTPIKAGVVRLALAAIRTVTRRELRFQILGSEEAARQWIDTLRIQDQQTTES
ncbi:MAG: hypothetical protein KA244_04550 [Deltaproteobacteria bacterium]|nr:hypothetical protein [Deltaproteobacteria bacterium]